MGILVEDMLLLARLDQQRPLEARPVDLLSLAADAVHDARVVAPDRSINLTVGSGAALLVIGDEVRLRQVIGNLMSNALSHTPDGTPIDVLIRSGNLDEAPVATTPPPPPEPVSRPSESGQFSVGAVVTDDAEPATNLHTVAADDTVAGDAEPACDTVVGRDDVPARMAGPRPSRRYRPAAVLEVIDHGPGLTRDQATHVFERFYRADQARTAGGTGLGLAIVAALVAAHGGATWVRSQPGQGATFCIALPLSPEAVQGSDDDFADADEAPDESDVDRRLGLGLARSGWAAGTSDRRARPRDRLIAGRAVRSRCEHSPGRVEGGIAVRAAEQADMHQQRMQLVQRQPVPPAIRERRRLLIRGQDPVQVRRAEQRQHRQVSLPVTALRRRVDQPAPAAGPQHVSGPAVAVDAARWLGRPGELRRPRARRLDQLDVGAAQESRVRGQPGVGQTRFAAYQSGQLSAAPSGSSEAGDHARPRRAEPRRTGPVQPSRVHGRSRAAASRLGPPAVHPFEDQAARVTSPARQERGRSRPPPATAARPLRPRNRPRRGPRRLPGRGQVVGSRAGGAVPVWKGLCTLANAAVPSVKSSR